jgi:hypothetical protein
MSAPRKRRVRDPQSLGGIRDGRAACRRFVDDALAFATYAATSVANGTITLPAARVRDTFASK